MIRRVFAIAQITVLETLWKKHPYVLMVVLLGVYYFFGRFDFFSLGSEASFMRLVPLTGITLLGVLISVFAASRQFPEEIAQKTIFPLLAKPVSRFEYLLGKFLGVCLVAGTALFALAGVFYLMLTSKGIVLNQVFWQAVVLAVLQIFVFIALVIALSTMMSHAATVVMSFLLYYLLGSAGSTLEDLIYVGAIPSQLSWFYKGLLLALPRFDLFNISKAVLHDAPARPWSILIPFLAYAACYSLVFLLIGGAVLRKKDL